MPRSAFRNPEPSDLRRLRPDQQRPDKELPDRQRPDRGLPGKALPGRQRPDRRLPADFVRIRNRVLSRRNLTKMNTKSLSRSQGLNLKCRLIWRIWNGVK